MANYGTTENLAREPFTMKYANINFIYLSLKACPKSPWQQASPGYEDKKQTRQTNSLKLGKKCNLIFNERSDKDTVKTSDLPEHQVFEWQQYTSRHSQYRCTACEGTLLLRFDSCKYWKHNNTCAWSGKQKTPSLARCRF